MEQIENPDDLVAREQERRGMPRCEVDADATLLVLSTGAEMPCRIVELSLGGCRVEMRQKVSFGVAAAVEVAFKIQGIAFRLSGLTEWTAGKIAGLSFGPMSSRRRDDLVEVLCEMEAKHVAEAREQGLEQGAEPETFAGTAAHRGPVLVPRPASVIDCRGTRATSADGFASPALEKPEKQLGQTQPEPPRDRRMTRRCEVDTSTVIYLVKIGSKLHGKILDLSLGGCRIHTAERFPAGIYTRVETEFRLQGLPLRLAGVIQAIHDRNLVGVRFLDVSPRKREQIAELIDEIVEMRAAAGTSE
jgi:PilZ domain-containing protein